MASYKVPQDVEADDKLIGPFSFRQFIYLIIVAMAGVAAWGLAQLFIGLAVIPLPIIIFFGALALPLRKDQPMEIYMAAMVSYYLKPRNRRWDPEGIETFIEISAPKVVEVSRVKELSQNEAQERLSYLANIVDSGGWAIRGVNNPGGNSSLNSDIYLEAQSAQDILDTGTSIAQNFDHMMTQSTERMHEEARARMMQATMPQPVADPVAPVIQAPVYNPGNIQQPQQIAPAPTPLQYPQAPALDLQPVADPQNLQFNPYPTFHQSIIQPLDDISHQAINTIEPTPVPTPTKPAVQTSTPTPVQTNPGTDTNINADITGASTPSNSIPPKDTSDIQLTTDIINLANNPDISIETIAHEAQRIHKKAESESDEVVISLR